MANPYLEDTSKCPQCGAPVEYRTALRHPLAHVSEHVVACTGCEYIAATALKHKPLDRGRLLKLKVQRTAECRSDALRSIRQIPKGWQAQIGGRILGRTEVFKTKADAITAVHEHYNEAMLRFIEGKPKVKS